MTRMTSVVRVCCFEGCLKRLRKDNRTGFCPEHSPILICQAEGCSRRLHSDNSCGFCTKHRHLSPKWRTYGKEWNKKDAPNRAKKDRAKYLANPQAAREKVVRWRKNEPVKAAILDNRRRHALKATIVDLVSEDCAILLGFFGRMCARCGSSENLEMDHIFPVKLGAPTSLWNVQPLCRKCNRSKSSKMPAGWTKIPM